MGRTITLTKDAAERIVKAGTRGLYTNIQGRNTPSRTWRESERRKVTVLNKTSSTVNVGEPIWIVGLAQTLSYDDQALEYKNKGILLSGDTRNTNYPDRPIAWADEPIEPGYAGECWVDDIRPAIITDYDTGDLYAELDRENGLYKATTGGEFWIVGKSESKEIPPETEGGSATYKYFGYVTHMGCSHYIGTTGNSPISGPNATTSVSVENSSMVIPGVKCPLLRAASTNPPRDAESIEGNTLVVVSKNILTGEWEIIEAQCPLES